MKACFSCLECSHASTRCPVSEPFSSPVCQRRLYALLNFVGKQLSGRYMSDMDRGKRCGTHRAAVAKPVDQLLSDCATALRSHYRVSLGFILVQITGNLCTAGYRVECDCCSERPLKISGPRGFPCFAVSFDHQRYSNIRFGSRRVEVDLVIRGRMHVRRKSVLNKTLSQSGGEILS